MGRASKPGQDTQEEAGDFLARWSRRKLEARREPAAPTDAPPVTAPAAVATEAGAESAPPERELTDADMPPLESLDADSDFTPFMSPGVSDGLRRQALRKLFNQPSFNITDGLNDYDEDYTQFAGLGSIVTHEMKRMLKRELEAAEAADGPSEAPAAQSRDAEAGVPAAADTGADEAPVDPEPGDAGPGGKAT